MDWYRRYHGTCADPKLRLVARTAKVPTPFAIAAWDACLEYASDRDDGRGSMEGYSAELMAVTIDIETEEAERLLAAFYHRGLILADGTVKAWSKRQPNDPTAAERMRRHREKKRSGGESGGSKADAGQETVTESATVTPMHRNGRNATVTPLRPEEESDSESETEDSHLPPSSSATPREPEDGAAAPRRQQQVRASPGGVSAETIDALMPMYETRNSRRGVERLVELLVSQVGSPAPVELCLQRAISWRFDDPIGYAQSKANKQDISRFAAVESAKYREELGKPDPVMEADRMTREILARMETSNDDDTTSYPGLTH